MMSRILHVGKYFFPFVGGIENFLADLMPIQAQQGYTVAALVHDHQPSWTRLLAPIQAEMWHNTSIYRVPSYGRLLYAPISPHFPVWFKRVLQEFQPHCLHIHLPNTSALLALVLSQAKHIPWIIHWHADVTSALDSRLSFAYRFYKPFEQQMLARAQAIIVTSPPYLASSLALAAWRDKCHLIPLGIDKQRLPIPTDAALRWAEQQWLTGKHRILTIGRLTYYKGHEVLIRALTEVEHGQLIIVGKGEKFSFLNNVVRDLGLTDRVKLLGYCPEQEVNALLASCDCFCLPSLERTEAFGVVLMEAMRYAKPVVASRIPGSGITWVVQDQRTGLLTSPQDHKALADSIRTLTSDPIKLKQMGEYGRQRFEELFDIHQVANRIGELYLT